MSEVQTEQPPQPKDESVLEEARNFLVQGKRFMALEDYQSATDHLEQAVQLFDAYYGVGKIQCADAYLEYGLALVALANLEAGSGTDKIMKKAGIEDEVDDEEEEDEEQEEEQEEEGEQQGCDERENKDETERSQSENGMSSNNKLGNGASSEINGDVAMETSVSSQELTKTNGASSSTAINGESEPMPGTSSGKTDGDVANGDEDDEDNEASTIEIAWEVLCLAKRLFMTDESLEGRLKLAETYQKLGEISIEWDNNDNAVNILEECLNLRKAILPPEDRLIALTYYHLGLAHSFKSEIQNANENFQNAVNVIEKRIEILTKDLEKAKGAQDTVVVSSYEKEINELKELLPDITMRMDDSKEDQERSTEVLKRTREELQQEDEQVKKVLLDTSKPVDDISHLVKRKAT